MSVPEVPPRRGAPAPGASAAGVLGVVRLVALALALSLGAPGARLLRADEPPAPAAPSTAQAAPAQAVDPLVFGTYPLHARSVVDGDTLRVEGERPIRVLGLDCEEVFHDAAERAAAEADFDAYARAKRGAAPRPVKFGTPAGEAAREFVRAFVRGVERVRLERDERGGHEIDGFDRRLAHVILLRAAGEQNLAVEVVRAGHSPYFVKYGRARRFHAELAAAEVEARRAQRGIWGSTGPRHYPDYDERLPWWEERAQQLDRWRAGPAATTRIELGTERSVEQLAQAVGQEVVVFGALNNLRTESWPHLIWLTHRRGADVTLVVRKQEVWSALDLDALASRFVTVGGTVSLYRGRPQIEIQDAAQVSTR